MTDELQTWEDDGGSIPSVFPSMTEWDHAVRSLETGVQSNQYDITSQKVRR